MNFQKLLSGLRNNIGLTIGAVISLFALGWIYAQVWSAYTQHADAATKLAEARESLDRLHSRNPFPHIQNIQTLSNNLVALNIVDGWVQGLSAATPAPPEVSRSEFNPYLVRRKGVLTGAAKEARVTLPENFGFGFSRYVNMGLAPANDPKEIALLLTQWGAIETMTQILFSNKVERIEAIRRATFEVPGGAGGTAAAAAMAGPAGEESVAAVIREKPTEMFRVLPFQLDFVCETDNLRAILNSFAKAPQFFVVRSVEVANSRLMEMQAGGRPEELMKDTGPAASAPAAAPAPASGAAETPAADAADTSKPSGPMLVFGLEKTHVKLRVDLVEFKPPAAKGKEPDSAPAQTSAK